MSRVIVNLECLQALAGAFGSKREVRMIIKSSCDEAQILRCLQEIALNVLASRVPLTKQEYKELSKSKTFLRRIGKKHVPLSLLRRQVFSHLRVVPHLVVPTLRVYKVTSGN
jgi:hypothetical protein